MNKEDKTQNKTKQWKLFSQLFQILNKFVQLFILTLQIFNGLFINSSKFLINSSYKLISQLFKVLSQTLSKLFSQLFQTRNKHSPNLQRLFINCYKFLNNSYKLFSKLLQFIFWTVLVVFSTLSSYFLNSLFSQLLSKF